MTRLAIVILMLLSAMPAGATEHWFVAYGGFSHYGLSHLTDASTTYRGLTLDRGTMDSDASLGGGFEIVVAPRWSVGLGYERLSARTSGSSTHSEIDASLPMHLIKASSSRRLLQNRQFALSAGLSVGIGLVAGTIEYAMTEKTTFEGEPSGAAFLLEGFVSGEYGLARRLRIFGAVGIRNATVQEMGVGAAPLHRDDNGQNAEFDYGGPFVRAGLKLALSSSGGSPF